MARYRLQHIESDDEVIKGSIGDPKKSRVVWLPRKHCEIVKMNNDGTMIVDAPKWLAERHGLKEETK